MSWKQVNGYLQQLDIGPDYELWGVDDNQVSKRLTLLGLIL